jgi:hypothetical protein
VHHSDRGAVYTSLAFSHRLAECGLAQSFGSPGDAYDNAAVEAFWATLKRELAWIHQRTTWDSRTELRTAVFDYIEAFYNPERIQQRLGHHSPAAYETSRPAAAITIARGPDEPVVAGRAGGPAATTQTECAVGRILQSPGREQHDRRLRGQGDRGWRWRAVDAGVAGRDRECGAADVWLAGDDDPAIEVPADEPTPVVAGT